MPRKAKIYSVGMGGGTIKAEKDVGARRQASGSPIQRQKNPVTV
jgi:hypothetical protein